MEVFASDLGLAQTQLNGRKLDPWKLLTAVVKILTKVYGQSAEQGSLSLQRPATDPNVAGAGTVCCSLPAYPSVLRN